MDGGLLANEWERIRKEMATRHHLGAHIEAARLMFFFGAMIAVRSVIHSASPSLHMVLLSSELREFEDQQRTLHEEAA